MAAAPIDPSRPSPEGYRAIHDTMAWADLGLRTAVIVAGADAVRFVDGFCTAAVGRIAPGTGSEAFFLDPRGHVLLWGGVLVAADGVWIDADSLPTAAEGAGWSLAAHLDRYHIRERLEVIDRSAELGHVLLAGPEAEAWLVRAGASVPPGVPFAHDVARMAAFAVGEFPGRCNGVRSAIVRRTVTSVPTFLVVVPAVELGSFVGRLRDEGIPAASAEAVDALRREQGRPAPGDIPPRTVPQELGRDRLAISFDKGCYLGQETVARLDALGHANRRLVGVLTAGAAPPLPGTPVEVPGMEGVAGTITSSGWSPRHGGWLGLALVRVGAIGRGAEWRVAGAPALPVPLMEEST